jgi:hypothetical protein
LKSKKEKDYSSIFFNKQTNNSENTRGKLMRKLSLEINQEMLLVKVFPLAKLENKQQQMQNLIKP